MQRHANAKRGDPQAVNAMREMQARIWTQMEVDAVNTVLRHHSELHKLDRLNAHGTVYLRKHFLDSPELATIVWTAHIERDFYLIHVHYENDTSGYWVFTHGDRPVADVTHWVSDVFKQEVCDVRRML